MIAIAPPRVSQFNASLVAPGPDDWATPPDFFRSLDREFRFTLDPCATPQTAVCARYFTAADDGIRQPWGQETVFVNPPYGYGIRWWVQKAYEASQSGAVVVCLLPARTDTRWWHRYVARAAEIRFVRGRLRFGGAQINAPFPNAVVVFRPGSPALRVSHVPREAPGRERPASQPIIWPSEFTPDGRARVWVQPDPNDLTQWTHIPIDELPAPEPEQRDPAWDRCPCCPNGFVAHPRETENDDD
jgi:phage N-6-adenine-methyltransferase